MKLEVVHTCLRCRSCQALLRETGISARYRLQRQRGLPGDTIHSPCSEASIIFGKGLTSAQPGSIDRPILAVHDVDIARDNLIARGVDVSEVFHYAYGIFNNAAENPRVRGRDPQDRSYYSFPSFEDPDGNGWLLQEILTWLPGREWNLKRPQVMDVATLAGLIRQTSEHHDHFEKTHS